MSSGAATATRQLSPVAIWMSSTASTLAGSATASSSVSLSRWPTGIALVRRAELTETRFAAAISTG